MRRYVVHIFLLPFLSVSHDGDCASARVRDYEDRASERADSPFHSCPKTHSPTPFWGRLGDEAWKPAEGAHATEAGIVGKIRLPRHVGGPWRRLSTSTLEKPKLRNGKNVGEKINPSIHPILVPDLGSCFATVAFFGDA